MTTSPIGGVFFGRFLFLLTFRKKTRHSCSASSFVQGVEGLVLAIKVGTNIIGTTDSYAQDSYAIVNPFINYEITNGLILSLNVNNMFDAFGLSESEEGSIPGNNIIRARGINGWTTSLTLM